MIARVASRPSSPAPWDAPTQGFLQRNGRLQPDVAAAAQVTRPNVNAYIVDLTARVRSVTVYNCIYMLRRAAELLAPTADFSWLAEIENDLALVMEPRPKFDRMVSTDRLLEAGLALVMEAQDFAKNDLARARGIRNGLMIALLALCPIRLKSFAALEIGATFKHFHGRWWITLPRNITKSRRPDERPTRIVEPCHRCLCKRRVANSRWVPTVHPGALDLFHHWQADDRNEPRRASPNFLLGNTSTRWICGRYGAFSCKNVAM